MPTPDAPTFRRLLPEPAELTATELLAALEAPAEAGLERPYTVVNFVSSADGRAAFEGRSAPLSDPGDRAMFHGLRERVDAVFAGTGTMRAERYGRMVRDPARRQRRVAGGLAPDPLACVITRTGEVPLEIPLFADPDSRVVVFTARPFDTAGVQASLDTVLLDRGELTLTTMLRRLRSDYGVRTLLCEGGPTVFGALLHEDLVDELFLTVAPRLTGGGADPSPTAGPALAEPSALRLIWVVEREGTLFLRYARDR
ncbi:MAG TPA: dihydrofolate reductase family protein [Solirubrobacteraceae bacterium]|nr:dihydrofolate reductase family protein [Solirubrobacteraceae bacterium]